ncbi:MAG: glycosyltransferase [Flavobacteriales bacterium]
MHVLLLPKWYPGRRDPQLGDFIRKQALAAGAFARLSVLHIEAVPGLAKGFEEALATAGGAWELAVRYRASTAKPRPVRRLINLVRYWRAAQRGWRRVRRERGRPDLLHAYILMRPALFAAWIAWREGIPVIISEQSSEYLDGTYAAKGPLFHALSRWLFRRAKAVTAVSSMLGDALVGHGLCRTYSVVPNVVPGLDRPLPPKGPVGHFLIVADLVDRTKNVSGALRALALARQQDEKAHLSIIGDGPDRSMLEQLATDARLTGAVRFLGRMGNSEVLDTMAGAFAVIVNSNVETFSVVTGEALASGKPVIATRCGGPQAFVTDANGILIAPRDDAALAAAMLRMMAEEARYDPTAVRASVGDRFSPGAVGRAFHAIYARCMP